ncbi:MAG: DUF1835 domain-containing protein [Ginsengibacter sp.]
MHIVFQKEDINTLSKSFDLDESLRDEIIQIKDDFSVGPLKNIFSDEGIEARKQWWRNLLSEGDYEGHVDTGELNGKKTVEKIKGKLETNEKEKVWIWVASNKQDVSGYYWIMAQLKEFVGRVYILSLNNLPFINDKGNIFYPENLYEIPPREFLKAKKLVRPVTPSEFEIDPDEWTKICNENKLVRILEGAKKLSQHDADIYDKYILDFINNDWQKANKIIQQFLNKSKHTTSEAFALFRLKELISKNLIDAQGEIEKMKDFEVKRKVEEEKYS